MHILVTGGAGFIGSKLVKTLITRNYDTSVLDNLSTGKKENLVPKVSFYHGDIRDKEFVTYVISSKRPEVIIHLAAQVSVQASVNNPIEDSDINITGTLNILDAATKFGVRKIIYASSAAVYGKPEYLPIDERHPTNPLSCYGVSKYCAEQYIKTFSSIYGLDYTILRYANVYGPSQLASTEGGVIAIFMKNFFEGSSPVIYGDGEQTRDFIFVNDVISANLASLYKGDKLTLNIGTNSSTTIKELVNTLQSVHGKILNPIPKPKRPHDILHSVLDIQAAKLHLGWEPEYTLKDGFQETIQAFAHLKAPNNV
ncbi:MAG: GDP-mannose 4,6-dehydratase [Desulfitobacterium hafniense]|nr:GDP-mannose 4,6-dehydratase [Desulfitobacterium hafniense]